MARPIIWPAVQGPAAAVPPEPASPWAEFDLGGFGAALGPQLSRLFGFRISVKPAPPPGPPGTPAATLGVARLRLSGPGRPGAIDLDLGAKALPLLMDRLFGGRPVADASLFDPTQLPPGSASWSSLCRLMATAAASAFEAAGIPPAASPILPSRAMPGPAPGLHDLALAVDLDGSAATLWLRREAPPVALAEAAPQPDAAVWRQRARQRAFEMELPVSLRLGESRIPLVELAALRAGDILPIDRPDTLDLMVNGRRIGKVPASALKAPGDVA